MRLNIFKKQKKDQETRPKEEIRQRESSPEAKTVELKGDDFSYGQIVSPYLTEKTSLLNVGHQYAFKVFPTANKVGVKKAIERLYGVHVEKVRIMVVPGKKRHLGRFEGEKTGFKKAIVRLRQGEKISSGSPAA